MAEVVGDIRRQARALAKIQKKPELEASLRRWDEDLKVILTSIESKRTRAVAAKNEIYLLVSFYLVFQGGVMNSLASKANAQSCGFALFPAALSTLALVAVLVSVHDKFHDYHKMKEKRLDDESESTKLQYNIHMMLENFEEVEMEIAEAEAEGNAAPVSDGAEATEADGASSQAAKEWFLHERRYFDVMAFLFAVYVIVLINSIFVC